MNYRVRQEYFLKDTSFTRSYFLNTYVCLFTHSSPEEHDGGTAVVADDLTMDFKNNIEYGKYKIFQAIKMKSMLKKRKL